MSKVVKLRLHPEDRAVVAKVIAAYVGLSRDAPVPKEYAMTPEEMFRLKRMVERLTNPHVGPPLKVTMERLSDEFYGKPA